MELDNFQRSTRQPQQRNEDIRVGAAMAEEQPSETGTPLWGAGSSADAVGQQTNNQEAPGAAMRRVKKRVDDDARRRITGEPKLVVPWDNPANFPPEPEPKGVGEAIPMLRVRNDRPANVGDGEFWPDELLDPLEGIDFEYGPEDVEEKVVRKKPIIEFVRDFALFGELPKLMKWVEEGNDVNRPTEHGTTLFHECVLNKQLHCAAYLIQQGADVNLGNLHDGITPLHDAAREGDRDVVAFVLQKGAQVDSMSDKGTTPLMRAAVGGSVPAIRCLIAFGADVTLKDKAGATAERFAVKYGNNEARDVLKERARVLELVAWHKEAVREAAFWVQEAAAADAAVFSGVLCFTRRRRRVSRNTAQAQHAMEAEAERARVEACGAGARINHVEGGGAPPYAVDEVARAGTASSRRPRPRSARRKGSRRPRRSGSASRRPTKEGASSRRSPNNVCLLTTRRVRVLLPLGNGQGRRALHGPHAALAQERVAVDPAVGLLEGLRAVAAECSGEHVHPPRMVVEVRRDVVDLAFIHGPRVLY